MSDEAVLSVVILLLYLVECSEWVGGRSVVFLRYHPRRWSVKKAGDLIRNARGGFVFANPLPPFGPMYLCQPWPLTLTAEAVCNYTAQNLTDDKRRVDSVRRVDYASIETLDARDRTLHVNGEPFHRFESRSQCLMFAAILRRIRGTAAAEREARIGRYIRWSLDPRIAGRRMQFGRAHSFELLFYDVLLFLAIFLYAPLVVFLFGIETTFLFLISGIYFVNLVALFFSFRAHASCHPQLRGERWGNLAKGLVFPPFSIRLYSKTARDLLCFFHPLAVARQVLDDEDYVLFLNRTVSDLRYPMVLGEVAPDVARDEEGFRALWLRVIDESPGLVDAAGSVAGEGVDALYAGEEGYYCPRCRGHFLVEAGSCPDCYGVELKACGGKSHGP